MKRRFPKKKNRKGNSGIRNFQKKKKSTLLEISLWNQPGSNSAPWGRTEPDLSLWRERSPLSLFMRKIHWFQTLFLSQHDFKVLPSPAVLLSFEPFHLPLSLLKSSAQNKSQDPPAIMGTSPATYPHSADKQRLERPQRSVRRKNAESRSHVTECPHFRSSKLLIAIS